MGVDRVAPASSPARVIPDERCEEREMAEGSCVVIGAGDGTGAAVARAFAREGLVACLVRRPRHADALEALAEDICGAGGSALPLPADARDEDEVARVFDHAEAEAGPVRVAVFNVGANVRFGITDTTARVYEKVWQMAALAGFLTVREAARVMRPRGEGTIIATGATASLRGSAGYSAFASAKAALRATAQSAARELGPEGIHVAHVVIDGMIDGKFVRDNVPDASVRAREDRLLTPDAVAAEYVRLHRQPRSAWTHELDLRPYAEEW